MKNKISSRCTWLTGRTAKTLTLMTTRLKQRLLVIAICVMVSGGWAGPVDFGTVYMSPEGDDVNQGAAPVQAVKSVQRAVELANQLQKTNPHQNVVVYLAGGRYSFSNAAILMPAHSGVEGTQIIFKPLGDETPVFTARVPLTGLSFTPHETLKGVYTSPVPTGLVFEELYIDGQIMHLARFPNYDPNIRIFNGTDPKCIDKERVDRWKNPQNGYLHALQNRRWASAHFIFMGKKEDGNIDMQGGWQNNRATPPHTTFRFVENIYEEMDVEGEWFLDRENSLLHVFPLKGMDLAKAAIDMAPVDRESLVRFEGSEQSPVRNIVFDGITFTGTARTFMKTKEPLLRSDWTIYRSGAVYIGGSEDCQIRNCNFYNIGGNAVFIDGYNKNIEINSNHMYDLGASAVCVVGDTKAVRNPKYKPYGRGVSAKEMDWTPGPKSNNYPRSIRVYDNLIHDIGRVEKQVAGVQISVAYKVSVIHNSIYRVPRAGINVGEGAFGGHDIAYNDVFKTVLETGDHGAFNAWGRDRYWWSGVKLDQKPETVLLDCLAPTDIRNNRWKCEHGWDIDLDDGASHYNIYNNLCLNGGLKLREGFHRVARNNICVVNGTDFHAWYKNSYDVVSQNILMNKHHVRVNGSKNWGTMIDYNFFDSGVGDDERFVEAGIDQHSLKGDPLFMDPENLDFRVEPASGAYAIGFRNFDMESFGVVSPRLSKIAEKPVFNKDSVLLKRKEGKAIRFMGMDLKNLENISDMSATGMGDTNGVMVLKRLRAVDRTWGFLREMDVILSIDGQPVKNVDELKAIMQKLDGKTPREVEIFRRQKRETIQLSSI